MSKLILLIFLYVFCIVGVKTIDYCQPNYVVGDFPEQIMKDMYNVATGKGPDFHGCSDNMTVDSDHVGLWYNNKENPNEPLRLNYNNPKEIDASKHLIVLVHGWLCNITSNLMPELKDAYLKHYENIQIIRVEWNTYATDSYADSYCYIPKIAELVGKFLCNLHSTSKLDFPETHIVGHSMGGQISGLIGKEVKKQCKQTVGRITGLDPAGPLYQNAKTSERLHKTDATLVDVIHTNQKQTGFFGDCGTVDFYPNCGFFQPNSMRLSKSIKLEEMRHLPLYIILRSHLLAAEYFIESISSTSFKATSCLNCEIQNCIEERIFEDETIMGEHYPNRLGRKSSYVLTTNGVTPYCREFVAKPVK